MTHDTAHAVTHVPGKKYGGKPLIVWVGVPAALYVGWRWWKSRNAPAVAASDLTYSAPAPDGSVNADPTAGNGGYSWTGTANVPSQAASALTDAAWASQGAAYAISQGYGVDDSFTGLSNYLSDLPLTTGQGSVVEAVLSRFGPPPSGIQPLLHDPTSAASPVNSVPSDGTTPIPAATPSGANPTTMTPVKWGGTPPSSAMIPVAGLTATSGFPTGGNGAFHTIRDSKGNITGYVPYTDAEFIEAGNPNYNGGVPADGSVLSQGPHTLSAHELHMLNQANHPVASAAPKTLSAHAQHLLHLARGKR